MNTKSPEFLELLAKGPVRMNGVTYFLYRDKIRTCKSYRGPKKTRGKGDELPASQFKEVRELWRKYREATWGLRIWNIRAKEINATKSDKLFLVTNGACFQTGVGLRDFHNFCFSAGTLDAPVLKNIKRKDSSVTFQWEYDTEGPNANAFDLVYLGYFYGTDPRSPLFLRNLPAQRSDGKITVEIPRGEQPLNASLHLYLFFGTIHSDRFSPSVYACV